MTKWVIIPAEIGFKAARLKGLCAPDCSQGAESSTGTQPGTPGISLAQVTAWVALGGPQSFAPPPPKQQTPRQQPQGSAASPGRLSNKHPWPCCWN